MRDREQEREGERVKRGRGRETERETEEGGLGEAAEIYYCAPIQRPPPLESVFSFCSYEIFEAYPCLLTL